MTALTIVITVLACLFLGRWIFVRMEVKQRCAGTFADRFVLILNDGSARELNDGEKAHLNGEYKFGDGNRPYIKPRYNSLTPDGRMFGYLRRSKLPGSVGNQRLAQ